MDYILKKYKFIIIAISLVLAFIVGNNLKYILGLDSRRDDWVEFTSESEGFKVLFPFYPEEEASVEKIPETELTYEMKIYSIGEGDNSYAVMVTHYPESLDTSNSRVMLESGIEGALASTEGNKLIYSDYNTWNGYACVNLRIENSNKGFYINSRYILVDRKLFAVACQSKVQEPEEYRKFLDSFELI